MSTRIVIINYWHDSNKGDSAILIGTITAIRSALGSCEVTVISFVSEESKQSASAFRHVSTVFPQITTMHSPTPVYGIPKIRMVARIIRGALKLWAPSLIPTLPAEAALKNANLVIGHGGLYHAFPHHNPLRPPVRIFALAYPMLLARRYGKNCVMYGHSFGPFNNWLSRKCITWFLKNSDLVITRESRSETLVLSLGVSGDKVINAPDPAFAMASNEPVPQSLIKKGYMGRKFVSIVPRYLVGYGHDESAYQFYIEELANVIKYIVKSFGLSVVIVAQTLGPNKDEDDRPVAFQLYDLLEPSTQAQTVIIDDDLSPSQLIGLYRASHLVLATRFHAAVFSILAQTPVIAIPYFGSKTQGAFEDLGLQDWVIELNNASAENIKSKMRYVLDNYVEVEQKFVDAGFRAHKSALGVAQLLEPLLTD